MPKQQKRSSYTPCLAKDKGGCWGWWFGTSEERKAIHMEMEKQMFGEQILAGHFRDNGISNGL